MILIDVLFLDLFYEIAFILTQLGVIIGFTFGTTAFFSVILIKGISERNATKVCIFKWFLIVSLVLHSLFLIKIIIHGNHQIYYQLRNEVIVTSIFIILWLIYEIFVIDSLEITYKECSDRELLLPHSSVPYQVYANVQAPVIVNQPYFAPRTHDNFNINPPPPPKYSIN